MEFIHESVQFPEPNANGQRAAEWTAVRVAGEERERSTPPMRSGVVALLEDKSAELPRSDRHGRRETRFFRPIFLHSSSSPLPTPQSHDLTLPPLDPHKTALRRDIVQDARRQKLLCCSPMPALGPHGPQLRHLCVAGTVYTHLHIPNAPRPPENYAAITNTIHWLTYVPISSCAAMLLLLTRLSPSSRARRALMYVVFPHACEFFFPFRDIVPVPTADAR